MRRSRPLRSNPDTIRAWRARSSRPLPQARPAQQRRQQAAIRERVFRRDGGCLIAAIDPRRRACFGPLTPHHRRKASQGGAYSLDNLVTACASHNDLIEADADLAAAARTAGFVVRRGDPGWDLLR